VALVQYSFTHRQYTEHRERNIHNNKKKIGKCGPCPVFASYTPAFALQLRKKYGKTSVRVDEKCPDIPVAVVQYTFTHRQYTEKQCVLCVPLSHVPLEIKLRCGGFHRNDEFLPS
jgi:hypothetical protein